MELLALPQAEPAEPLCPPLFVDVDTTLEDVLAANALERELALDDGTAADAAAARVPTVSGPSPLAPEETRLLQALIQKTAVGDVGSDVFEITAYSQRAAERLQRAGHVPGGLDVRKFGRKDVEELMSKTGVTKSSRKDVERVVTKKSGRKDVRAGIRTFCGLLYGKNSISESKSMGEWMYASRNI